MNKKNFAKLIAGMEDATAYLVGDTSRGVAHVVEVETVDVSAIRKSLGLSRPKFAERFGLEKRTIQDWEQGRRRPDRTARTLLKVIAHSPDVVAAALVDAAAMSDAPKDDDPHASA